MSITYVGGEFATNSASKTHTVNVPASTENDDVLIAFGYWGDDDHDPIAGTGPSAFTQFEEQGETVGSDVVYWAGYRVAATEPASYDFTGVGVGTENGGAFIVAFRGVDISSPLDVAYVTATHYARLVDDNTPTPKAITTANNNSVVVLLFGLTGDVTAGPTPPAGYTSHISVDEGFSRILGCGSLLVPTAGVETPGDWTLSGAAAEVDNATLTIALREGAAATSHPQGPFGHPFHGPFGGPV